MIDAEIRKINQESAPQAGTSYPAGKPDTENDGLGRPSFYEKEAVRDAVVQSGEGLKAIKVQAGKAFDNMTQENSGCDCDTDD